MNALSSVKVSVAMKLFTMMRVQVCWAVLIVMARVAAADPIHDAARAGDVAKVKKFIEGDPALVNVKDRNGRTPLHWAAMHYRKETTELLLAHKADVNVKDNDGATPLTMAAGMAAAFGHPVASGQATIAELLIAKGAEVDICSASALGKIDRVTALLKTDSSLVNTKDSSGRTPLHLAAMAGRKELTELLLANKADVNAKDKEGITPLHLSRRNQEVVELLLAKRADPNMRDKAGRTALHRAVDSRRVDAARSLVSAGADVSVKDQLGRTPLHLAFKQDLPELGQLLLSKGAEFDIFVASAMGNTNRMAELLKTDPNAANSRDEDSWSPLHWAAKWGRKDAAEILLAQGAQVSGKDARGITPLSQAAQENHTEVAELLVNGGADVNAQANDSFGHAPLHWAAGTGNKRLLELLLSKGADPRAKNKRGETPLRLATQHGRREAAELLLAKGAEPDIFAAVALKDTNRVTSLLKDDPDLVRARDASRLTPLHWSAKHDAGDAAELLLGKGADISAKSEAEMTPLHVAAGAGHKKMVELLLAKGGDINASATKSWVPVTPLHLAANRDSQEVAQFLVAKGAELDIFSAAALGKSDRVATLLKTDPNLARAMTFGLATPLHWAARWGHKAVAALLLANRVDINSRDLEGKTPLRWAVDYGQKDMVEFLRQHGGTE